MRCCDVAGHGNCGKGRVVRARFVFAVTCVVSLSGLASVAAAGSGPTGDASTIAFYRHVASVYRRVPSVALTRRGYLSYVVAGPTFRFVDGEARPPGYRSAVESVVAVLRNGRVAAYVDHARAAGLPPLTIIEDASGVWASDGRCFYRNPRSSGILGWGSSFVGVYGSFAPLQRAGSVVSIRSTFPWGKAGAQAIEIDHFNATTSYWQSYRVAVTGGGAPAFAWTETGFRELKTRTTMPAVSRHC